jgi:hypothetical protein
MQRHNQNQQSNKIETVGIWAANIILLAFFVAGQVIK